MSTIASSAASGMCRMKCFQLDPFTSTLSSWVSTSARTGRWESSGETAVEEVAVTTDADPDVDDDTWSRVCSASAPSVALAAETRVSRTEESMNVTDTDVISRTASVKWGVHGRIACHIDDCPVGGDADVDCSACMSRIVSRIFGFRGWCNT